MKKSNKKLITIYMYFSIIIIKFRNGEDLFPF